MSFLLHVLNANRCSTPVATVFPIPCLCSDFRPVLEGHPDIVFAVHCDEIHPAAPQPGVELLDEFLLPNLLDEVVHLTAPGLAILDGFTGLVVLRLHRFIPADQFVVIPVIIILVLRDPGVLSYELLYLVGRMPHLGPVPAAALTALDFAGEDGYAAVTSPAFTPPLDFFLHPVEDLRADEGFVVIFHIVLWHFPFIHFRFFGQEKRRGCICTPSVGILHPPVI